LWQKDDDGVIRGDQPPLGEGTEDQPRGRVALRDGDVRRTSPRAARRGTLRDRVDLRARILGRLL